MGINGFNILKKILMIVDNHYLKRNAVNLYNFYKYLTETCHFQNP